MNCDQVFEVLTRGPFPTGTSCDAAVEAHLHVCAECHRLAEALRPALELFQEAVGPEESRDLPGYWCAVAAEAAPPAVSYADDRKRPRQAQRVAQFVSQPWHWTARMAWSLAAALALGVTLGSLVSSRSPFRETASWRTSDNGPASAIATTDDPHVGRRLSLADRQFLASLPAACSNNRSDAAEYLALPSLQLNVAILVDADLSSRACCSDCHNSQVPDIAASATLAASQRCQLCHTD